MSDYLDPNNQELLKDFFAEAQSQVDALERNILVLENDPGNHDAVDEIFRAAHTLKGGAATVEMSELTQFTHVVEDLLDAIRSSAVTVNEAVIDALLSGIDMIKSMLDARADGRVYEGPVDAERERLGALIPARSAKGAAKGPAAKAAPAIAKATPAAAKAPEKVGAPPPAGLTEYEILEMREAAGTDRSVYMVEVSFDESNVMNTVGPIHAFAALRDIGSVLKTEPDFENLYEDAFQAKVTYFVASDRKPEELSSAATIPDVVLSVSVKAINLDGASENAAPATPAPAVQKPAAAQPAVQPAASRQPEPSRATPATASAQSAPASVAQSAAPAASAASPALSQNELEAALAGAMAPSAFDAEHAEHDAERNAELRKAGQQSGSILRVDSRRIDNLLNQVSETVINKATFNQISAKFGELQSSFQASQARLRESLKELFDELPEYFGSMETGRAVKDIKKELAEKYGSLYSLFDPLESEFKGHVAKFRSTAQNLGRITGELQEGVMRIRMVPISQIFSRFPRLVRDLSKNLSKKVNLVIEGEETELDKSVIEDLLDPLMHSVRNALDHGIESPADRLAAGKSEEGTVYLRASNEGNMIVIEITDDGKGIDVESVRRKAVERGLIHPSKALTELESFNLIFEPGFSTAASITSISGRGVGLDVVKRQIEKLNGTVTVSSQKGKGTRFIIKLPLTLAIIQGLLVRVGKETYSIPITSVIESHRIKPSDVRMIDNYEVFNVRNDVVSLLRLDRVFRIPNDEQGDYCFVVIVGTADKRMGLMVDSLIGEEDVVIKPLRDHFTNSPGIAGASILGDGSVCLIIDVSQLLELGQKKELEERQRLEATIR